MEVPTPPIWKTSTCLTLPSAALTPDPRSAAWMSSAWSWSASVAEPDRAVLACRVLEADDGTEAGADAAGVQEDPGTPSRGSWRTSRWAGDRPPCW